MILYQGLLKSTASWARVGRGTVAALIELGHDVATVSTRGFGYREEFPLPAGLREIRASEAHALPPPELGLGFLHPLHLGRLLGRCRANLFVWEGDRLPRAWIAPLASECDRVVVPSEFTRAALIASGLPRKRILVAPYGHDPALAELARERSRPRDGNAPFTFLAVTAPHWRKGVRELCLAYRRAFTADDAVVLVLKSGYDPGSARRRFSFEIPSWGALLEECGLGEPGAPTVRLDISAPTDAGMASIYREGDVLVGASWGESFGLVLLEACAAGLAVVTTDWSAPREWAPPEVDRIPCKLREAGDALYVPVPGARVAVPEVDALAECLRWHHGHRGESRQRGLAAAAQVRDRTWRAATEVLLAELAVS